VPGQNSITGKLIVWDFNNCHGSNRVAFCSREQQAEVVASIYSVQVTDQFFIGAFGQHVIEKSKRIQTDKPESFLVKSD
jgi:hypothetical protein